MHTYEWYFRTAQLTTETCTQAPRFVDIIAHDDLHTYLVVVKTAARLTTKLIHEGSTFSRQNVARRPALPPMFPPQVGQASAAGDMPQRGGARYGDVRGSDQSGPLTRRLARVNQGCSWVRSGQTSRVRSGKGDPDPTRVRLKTSRSDPTRPDPTHPDPTQPDP